jgi:hypothetical protein
MNDKIRKREGIDNMAVNILNRHVGLDAEYLNGVLKRPAEVCELIGRFTQLAATIQDLAVESSGNLSASDPTGNRL